MKKFSYLMAAAVVLSGAAQMAHADFILSAVRTTTTIPAEGVDPVYGYNNGVLNGTVGETVDVITFKIINDGNDQSGTTLSGFNLTATTPGSTVATSFIFQTYDGDSQDDGGNIWSVNTGNLTGQPVIAFGSGQGSWIRSPITSKFVFLTATPANTQDPNGDGSVDVDIRPGYTNNHSFSIVDGYTGAGDTDTSALQIASLVVPVGTTVELSGTAGGNLNNTAFAVDLVNSVSQVPEPASLGLLALGGLALMARRKNKRA